MFEKNERKTMADDKEQQAGTSETNNTYLAVNAEILNILKNTI